MTIRTFVGSVAARLAAVLPVTARRLAAPLVATCALALVACEKPSPPARQVTKIALLPDKPPPPPPPPPKEEPKPKPVEQAKARPLEAPKPLDAPPPAPAPLKMEGAAGNGPSPFAAGGVSNDYQGGDPVTTGTAGGTGPSTADRAQERFFANSARQLLRDEIERHLKSEAAQLTAVFSVWFYGDGSIRRFELVPTGSAQADAELEAALAETSRALKLAPPAGLTQPLRFRLSLRPLG